MARSQPMKFSDCVGFRACCAVAVIFAWCAPTVSAASFRQPLGGASSSAPPGAPVSQLNFPPNGDPVLDDFSELGSDEPEACFEAKHQYTAISESAAKQKQLLDVFQQIYDNCASGYFNLWCVAHTAGADDPSAFLDDCDAKRGPDPLNSGAVCRYAKNKRDDITPVRNKYVSLAWILQMAETNCQVVPYECVAMADLCLEEPDMHFCFRECVRTGQMLHAMRAPAAQPMYGSLVAKAVSNHSRANVVFNHSEPMYGSLVALCRTILDQKLC